MGHVQKKKKDAAARWIPLGIGVCVAVVLLVIGSVIGSNDGAEAPDGLQILQTREQQPYVEVTTTYCTVRYPFAFSDLVQVRTGAEDGSERLIFTVRAGDADVEMFSICFGDDGAIDLGTVKLPGTAGVQPLTADIYTAPDTLDEDARSTYLAAQESFNDVLASLAENKNVTIK